MALGGLLDVNTPPLTGLCNGVSCCMEQYTVIGNVGIWRRFSCNEYINTRSLTLLHSERPKLYGVLAVLSAIGLNKTSFDTFISKSIFSARTSSQTNVNHFLLYLALTNYLLQNFGSGVKGQVVKVPKSHV